MARKLEYEIGVDSSKGIAGLKQFSGAVKKSMREIDDATDDGATNAQKLAKAYSKLADELEQEMKGAAKAADALGQALGPELAGRANVDSIVTDLNKMGLSFDEITADADTLAGSLKKLDSVQMSAPVKGMQDMEDSTRRAKGGIDDIGKSLDGAKSVSANAIGNMTQDLGSLGGVAGSAGVAIGQMGEYMADAAAQGEGMGTILKNFTTVAAPLAALSIGVGLITKAFEDLQEKNKRIAENSKNIAAGIADNFAEIETAADAGIKTAAGFSDAFALNFAKTQDTAGRTLIALKELGMGADDLGRVLTALDQGDAGRMQFLSDALQNTTGATKGISDNIAQLIRTTENYDDIVGLLKGNTDGLNGSMSDAAKTELEFVKAHEKQIKALEQLDDAAEDLSVDQVVKDTRDQLTKAKGGTEAWLKALEQLPAGAKDIDVLNKALEIYNKELEKTAVEDWIKAQKPIEDLPISWNQAVEAEKAYREGRQLTARQEQAIATLEQQYGLDRVGVLEKAKELEEQRAAAQKEANDAARQGLEDFAAMMDDFVVSALEAKQAVDEMVEPFAILGRKSDALSAIFNLKNAPKKAANAVRDVKLEIDDLSEALKDIKVSAVVKGDVKADKFLDAIDALGQDIQERVSEKFGTDGTEAATKLANSYIDQVTKELGGKFTREQVAAMLGLDDIETTLHVAVDQASLNEATGLLEVLTGIGGNDPWTAQIKLDMAAGNITPDTAKVLIARQLKNFGIEVPSSLLPPPGQSMDDAIRSANMYMVLHPGTIPTKATAPENLDFMLAEAQKTLDKPWNWVTVNAKAQLSNKAFDFLNQDSGGITPSPGGIVAEKRPEIVNGRYLVVSPTVVPPGTRVTSGARTAHILKSRGTRGLRKYDAGGTVPAGPINVTINTGVIADTYGMMNIVNDSMRRAARLLPRHG